MSSTFSIGRLLLVRMRKPWSQYDRPIRPLGGSLSSSLLPTGPSSAASTSLKLSNRKGVSKTPNSLSMPVSRPGPIIDISTVPPCIAEAMTTSPPSVPPG